MPETTKVSLKTSFSRPLLVKEVLERDLPKPVPFDWIRISPVKVTAVII